MSQDEPRVPGSKFLYEPFQYAPVHQVEANERVQEARWKALEYRLGVIEHMLERLERRLWLTIFGVTAAILAETLTGFLAL